MKSLTLTIIFCVIVMSFGTLVDVPKEVQATGILTGKKIVVNPGHGWYDKGGDVWGYQREEYWGIREDLINSEITMYLVELLQDAGADVYPVREMNKNAGVYNSDKPRWHLAARYFLKDMIQGVPSSVWDYGQNDWAKDINSRPRYANWLDADLLVSIHNNGCSETIAKGSPLDPTNSCRGTETWYDTSSDKPNESRVLATLIQNRVLEAIRGNIDPDWYSRGVKQSAGSYGELVQAEMPTALIEVAYHNRESPDNEMLHREDFKRIVAQAILTAIEEYFAADSVSVTDISNPDSYSCSQAGFVDFEGFPDRTNLSSGTIAGMQFMTTGGYTWLVGDFATGHYNGKYPNGAYVSHGTHWAWLGENQGEGRIDFPSGAASYISLLVSNYYPVYLDAYNSDGDLIATAGPSTRNTGTGHMTELKITRATRDIAYVVVHDQGNYFEVDDVCTNAPGTPNTINRVVDQTYYMQSGQSTSGTFFLNLISGFRRYLRIFVGPFFSDVDLVLTRPDGMIVAPADPGVTFTKTANYIEVEIDDAPDGQWNYEIIANELEPGGENIRITVDDQLFIVINESPIISIPIDQFVQYSDGVDFDVPAIDPDDLPEELSFSSTGLPVGLVFADNQDGTATISGIVLAPPGTYPVDVTVTDPGGLSDTKTILINVLPEDARATYTGPMLVSTGCADCTAATIPLRATIQDITAVPGDPVYDPDAGDITNANVTFVDRGNGNAPLCSASVTLFDPVDPTLGTATCDWTADIGNNMGLDYTIGFVVDGYYARDSAEDDTLLVVSKPGSNFITGGGYLINQISGGIYAGDPGLKTNFGLNLKFNKTRTNIQGKVNILVRQGEHVYQIRTNTLTSLVVVPYDPANPNSGSAELIARANITDVTDPLIPISIAGNATLQVIMKDNGEPGSTDVIGFALWGRDGSLLFSSNWNGVKTIHQVLDGGNLAVH